MIHPRPPARLAPGSGGTPGRARAVRCSAMEEAFVTVVALFSVFGTPGLLFHLRNRHREKMRRMELDAAGAAAAPQLAALERERAALEERVRRLEEVVANVDFELNARLSRLPVPASPPRPLAADEPAAPALPPARRAP